MKSVAPASMLSLYVSLLIGFCEHPQTCVSGLGTSSDTSRRSALKSISSLTFSSASSFFAGSSASWAAAPLPPPTLSPDKGREDIVVPGVAGGARLRNVIVQENSKVGEEAWQPPTLFTKLGRSRILANELSPLQPSLTPFAADNELYYDNLFFGAWETTATLRRKVYPYGTEYVPSISLIEGSPRYRYEEPGNSATYEMHYFAPEAKSNGNSSEIDLSDPKLKIIADRAFNAKSLSNAYKQLSAIEEVQWDWKKDPTRLTISFSTIAEDMQPLGKRRGEVYITARKSETALDPATNQRIFCSSERVRSVTVGPGIVVVSDTETISEFVQIDANTLKGVSRIAVYLTPNPNSREGILWQDVGGKAVAFFDYDIVMKRKNISEV